MPNVMIERDGRQRVWRNLICHLAERNPPTFTAMDVADETDLEYNSVLQVLRRLRAWGYLRLVGFEAGEGDRGRQRHVFEVTDRGKKQADHRAPRRKTRR